MHASGQLSQKRIGRLIDDGVNGIEPQRIDVELVDPAQGVLDEVPPHFVAAGPFEIDGRPPGRVMPVAEITPKVGQIVSLGPDVVVNDVEHHGQTRAHGRHRPAVSVLAGRHTSSARQTDRRRRNPNCGCPGNWATGISSTAVTPKSTSPSSSAITPAKVPLGENVPTCNSYTT